MPEKLAVSENEVSLLDVYQFLKSGRTTLVVCSALGLTLGFVTAFSLPKQFQASALIEPATVSKKDKDSIVKGSVESFAVLVEKMKLPTYFGDATIKACDLTDDVNPAQALVRSLNPNVPRNSSYVSVTFKAASSAIAATCLESVLKDVVVNQAHLAQPLINNLEFELANAEQELQSNIIERDQQRIKNREKLSVAKSKLAAAADFVEKFSKDSLTFKFGDQQCSATALLLSMLMAQQNEIKDLEIQINALEFEVAANMTDKDQAVRRMSNKVSELKNALLPPNTKPATFAAPIYSPKTEVEPKRSVVILVGLMAGGFLGLMLLVAGRVRNNIRKQLKQSSRDSQDA